MKGQRKQINPDLTADRSTILDISETTQPRLRERASICSASSPLSVRALIYMHVCKESRSLWWVSVSVSPRNRPAVAALICGAGRQHGSRRNNPPASS